MFSRSNLNFLLRKLTVHCYTSLRSPHSFVLPFAWWAPYQYLLRCQLICNIRTRLSMDITRSLLVAVRGCTWPGKQRRPGPPLYLVSHSTWSQMGRALRVKWMIICQSASMSSVVKNSLFWDFPVYNGHLTSLIIGSDMCCTQFGWFIAVCFMGKLYLWGFWDWLTACLLLLSSSPGPA